MSLPMVTGMLVRAAATAIADTRKIKGSRSNLVMAVVSCPKTPDCQ
jgi:hypothetical protein